MTQTLVYAASALLIAVGLLLLWRDRRLSQGHAGGVEPASKSHVDAVVEAIAARRRHHGNARASDPGAGADLQASLAPADAARPAPATAPDRLQTPPSQVEAGLASVTESGVTMPPAASLPVATGHAPASRLADPALGAGVATDGIVRLRAAVARAGHAWDDDSHPEAVRNPNAERRWRQLAAVVDRAVTDVNALLAPLDIVIGRPGEAGWSFKNRGFGTFRRVRIAGASTAWLRLEIGIDGRVEGVLRAHDDARSFLNERQSIDANAATLPTLSDLLAALLVRIAEYGASSASQRQTQEEGARQEWDAVAALVAAAIDIANERLAPEGGHVGAVGQPAWDPDHKRFYGLADVSIQGVASGYLGIARGTDQIDCVLAPLAGSPTGPMRRSLAPVEGLTADVLATHLVACVRPGPAATWGDADHV